MSNFQELQTKPEDFGASWNLGRIWFDIRTCVIFCLRQDKLWNPFCRLNWSCIAIICHYWKNILGGDVCCISLLKHIAKKLGMMQSFGFGPSLWPQALQDARTPCSSNFQEKPEVVAPRSALSLWEQKVMPVHWIGMRSTWAPWALVNACYGGMWVHRNFVSMPSPGPEYPHFF